MSLTGQDAEARNSQDQNDLTSPELDDGPEDDTSQTTMASQASRETGPHVPRRLFVIGQNHRKFDDPFRDWDNEQCRHIAQRVAKAYSLDDKQDLFVKAAMVLKNPDPMQWPHIKWQRFKPPVQPLTAEETMALEYERQASFWDQPWPLKTTFLMLFVAAMVQGWSQTGTNGANLGLPEAFGWNGPSNADSGGSTNSTSDATGNCIPKHTDGWIFAGVNAAPYLMAGIFCWISDPVNELVYGRRGAIALSALLVFASSIGAAFTKGSWGLLLLCRALLGIGMGCKAAVVPVFAAEIAPAHLRGSLVMNWQVFDALGIFLGFTANIIAAKADPGAAWRWQVASSSIPAFALLWGTMYICWDSPRFLLKKERKNRKKYDRVVTLWEEQLTAEREAREQDQTRQGSTHEHQDQGYENTADEAAPTEETHAQVRNQQLSVPKWIYRSKLLPSSLRRHLRPGIIHPYRSPAFETLVLLRAHEILAAKELLFAHCQLMIELEQLNREPAGDELNENVNFSLKSSNIKGWPLRVKHLLAPWDNRFAYIRREAVAAGCVMLSQQLCGINVLIFYSATIFCSAGSGKESPEFLGPLWLSWGIGGVNFLFAFPAYRWIETRGRQWLVLATLPLLGTAMGFAALGFGLSNRDDPAQLEPIVFVFLFIFAAIYSFGLGPVPFTYSAEIFPLEHRMVGMSFAVSVNMLGAGVLALFVPKIPRPWILLTVFAGLNFVAFAATWRYVREVNGVTVSDPRKHMTALDLEQLFHIFRMRNWKYKGYQREVYLPYFWRSVWHIIRGKEKPKPSWEFYAWALHDPQPVDQQGTEMQPRNAENTQ